MGESDGYYNSDGRGPPPQQYGQYQQPQQQPNYGYNNNNQGYNQGYDQGQWQQNQQQQPPPPPPQDYQQGQQQGGYQQPNYGPPPQYSFNPPQGHDEKYGFDQAFKIEKPKYNDIWAGILVRQDQQTLPVSRPIEPLLTRVAVPRLLCRLRCRLRPCHQGIR